QLLFFHRSTNYLAARPVAVVDQAHFTVKDNNEFHLEGERQYVRRGDSVNITCPVFGYPTPGIKWTKDGKPLGEFSVFMFT
ncbi:hypothetical protein OSTOST_26203, partial [Ostertagia ostertagi]